MLVGVIFRLQPVLYAYNHKMGCPESRMLSTSRPHQVGALQPRSSYVHEVGSKGKNQLDPEGWRDQTVQNFAQLNRLYELIEKQTKPSDLASKEADLAKALKELEDTKRIQSELSAELKEETSQIRKTVELLAVRPDYEELVRRTIELDEAQKLIGRLSVENQEQHAKQRQTQLLHIVTMLQIKINYALNKAFSQLLSVSLTDLCTEVRELRASGASSARFSHNSSLVLTDETSRELRVMKLLAKEALAVGENSLLNRYFKAKSALQSRETMTSDHVLTLVNSCLNAKLADDAKAAEEGTAVADNEQYLLNFLSDTASLDATQIVEVLRGLDKLRQMKHLFAVQLCKIFNFGMIPYLACTGSFYNSMQAGFDSIQESSSTDATNSEQAREVHAVQACLLILGSFESDHRAASKACSTLGKFLPEKLLSTALLVSLLEKSHSDLEQFLSPLPTAFSFQELSLKVANELDLCFEMKLLAHLTQHTKNISKQELLVSLKSTDFKQLKVTKSQYLEAMIEGYSQMLISQGSALYLQFLLERVPITEEVFKYVTIQTFPFTAVQVVEDIYAKRIGQAGDDLCLSPETACVALISCLGVRFPDPEDSSDS
jgi:hypothetical protein